jgi:hypothetical protein
VILYQDFLGKFSVQGWFAIAFPFCLLVFVRSLFLVFSSTSLRHLFLSLTISFNFCRPNPVFSLFFSIFCALVGQNKTIKMNITCFKITYILNSIKPKSKVFVESCMVSALSISAVSAK